VAWLIFFSVRFGREVADAPGLEATAFAIIFGVPALALVALWSFFRIRHWIAHRPKPRSDGRKR